MIKLQVSDVLNVEAATLEEALTLIERVRNDILTAVYDDVEPRGIVKTKPARERKTSAGGDSGEAGLAAAYRAKFGKRFLYRPDAKDKGKTKIEALKEALAE